MRPIALLFALAALLSVAALGWLAADRGVRSLEARTQAQLSQALVAADQRWVEIKPNGLAVGLEGTAPDENARFRTLEIVGQLVDSRRVVDKIEIQATQQIVTPDFSLQILRNDLEISLIGLIPLEHGRNVILPELQRLGGELQLTDMLETADYEVPENWRESIAFALEAAKRLTRTHIDVTPASVSISGVTESIKARDALSRELERRKPDTITLDLELSAPLPVVNPYRFGAAINNDKLSVSACSADTDAALAEIVQALEKAGANQSDPCDLALGAPSADWSTVVRVMLGALSELSGGSIDITDLEVSLTAPKGIAEARFSSLTEQLMEDLPAAYHLTAVMPPPEEANNEGGKPLPPEFLLNLTEDGFAILRGSVRDEPQRKAVATFAASIFGASLIADELTLRSDVPEGWTALMLDGLRGAELMRTGQMRLTPTSLEITGRSDSETIGQHLSEMLSPLNSSDFEVRTDVVFDESLIEVESALVPETCAEELDAILGATQISFDPASAQISEPSLVVVDAIADILKACPNASFEIAGHTDSQGSEGSNQALSQSRADAVLDALLEREVVAATFTAKGYGETEPIADNSTEEGREMNRRIEFRLLKEDTPESENDEQN